MHNNDGTSITVSGGTSIYTIRLSGPNTFIIEFDDAIILGKNKTLGIKGSAATTGTKMRTTISWFEE